MPSNIIITFNLPRNCFTSLLPQTEGSVTLKGFGVGGGGAEGERIRLRRRGVELFQGRNRHHFPRKLAPVDSYLWKVEMFPIISFGSLELNKPVDVLTRFQGVDGGQAVQRDGTNIQLKGIGLT